MLEAIRISRLVLVLSIGGLGLGACSYSDTDGPGGKGSATYIIGAPYKIAGRWYTPREDLSYSRVGEASWYGPGFHGRRTASGERYNQYAMTAAHPTLPMPTIVRVTNVENGRSVVVRINDRGPFKDGRIIDLSKAAAEKLQMTKQGTARVQVTVVRDRSLRAKRAALGDSQTASTDTATTFEVRRSVAEREARGSIRSRSARSERAERTTRRTTRSRSRSRRQDPEGIGSAEARAARLARINTAAGAGSVGRPIQLQRSERASEGRYWIQVGSFTQRNNATTASADLRDIARPQVAALNVHGTRYYRVRLGPFENRAAARRALERIRRMDYPDAKILVK